MNFDPFKDSEKTDNTVYLISNKTSYTKFNRNNVNVINETKGVELINNWYINKEEAALDTEDNGLDPLIHNILLLGIGDANTQFIIDVYNVNNIDHFINDEILYIAHNAKYDYTMLKANYNITIINWYCTMIAEQKIWQGAGVTPSNYNGYKFGLNDVLKRRLNKGGFELDKSIRDEFIGIPVKNYNINQRHINYLVDDLRYLPEIKKSQEVDIEKYNLQFYIDAIGNQQCWAVGDMELAGFHLDIKAWEKLIEENKEKKFELELKLDNEVRRLRDKYLNNEEKKYLTGGIYDSTRLKIENKQKSLFDFPNNRNDDVVLKNSINWGSSDVVKYIFSRLKLVLPVEKHNVKYKVPSLYRKKKGQRLSIDNRYYKYSTNQNLLEELILDRPNDIAVPLIKLLLEHRKVTKQISTYGFNFIDKINKTTNCIHTQYRTDTAKTGRWQSGGGKNSPDKINQQNLPKTKAVRNCFRGKNDEFVGTHDLSGAEVTIVCDFANDQQLYKWAVINDDAHSPIAQATWRDIFHYRAGASIGIWSNATDFFNLKNTVYANQQLKLAALNNEKIKDNLDKSNNFIINKKINKQLRTEFKPMTFGTIYQMKAKKAGQTLNITTSEGAVGIESIKRAIPDTFKYVDNKIEEAFRNGYLILNNRTNSRIWFPELIRCYKENKEPDWRIQADVSGSAANAPFQGTQADMLKEAIIELSWYIKAHKLPITLPGMVHDEIVSRFKKYLIEPKLIWVSDKVKSYIQPKSYLTKPVNLANISKLQYDSFVANKDIVICNWPEFKKLTMVSAANRYLTHFKMGCDYDVLETWTK